MSIWLLKVTIWSDLCTAKLSTPDKRFDGNDLFSDFKVFSFARYDPCLSFSTEHWYDIWPAKQMDPLKKKQIVLQVHDMIHATAACKQ